MFKTAPPIGCRMCRLCDNRQLQATHCLSLPWQRCTTYCALRGTDIASLL
ncbi:hypothetical protein NBRC116593_34400 [Sulfitobacter pacificus]